MSDFVHLHVHSEFSLLDGVGRIDEYIRRLKQLGMSSMALTEHGNLYSAKQWWDKATTAGIKPILGIEGYLSDGPISNRSRRSFHLLLLAENQTGWRNLLKLSSRAYIDGFHYQPRFDYDMLAQYSEGLICTSACLGGPVANYLLHGELDRARHHAATLAEIFGPERFYIEVQYHGLEDQKTTAAPLIDMARKANLPVVATNDVHYVNQTDSFSQDLLLCIQTKAQLSDPKRMRALGSEFYLKSPQEMGTLFGEVEGAIDSTARIAEMCAVDLSFKGYQFPEFPIPDGFDANSYLGHLVMEGAQQRYGILSDTVLERIQYELGVINTAGFSTYFLIVHDLVAFAKRNSIMVGAGRGSAAGSIVSFCLDITTVDPLAYGLLFERFLQPGRVGMPDIDLDFDSRRRAEVIDYAVQKYGDDRVAQMATFGTLTARSAIRDTGRAMGLDYPLVDRLSNLVPPTVHMNLTIAMETVPELQAAYSSDVQARALIDSAFKLEGLARHASTHAAGIVISRDPLVEQVPLQRIGKKKEIVTQFSQNELEGLGLLKIDFLGLSMLSVMDLTCKLVRERKDSDFDLEKIPLDDPRTFAMLQRGETAGLFQIEGNMNTHLVRDIAPTSIEDIMAQIALSRPGPRDLAEQYIERKHGRQQVEYMHPLMESVLSDTYGVMIYQEQVTNIAHVLAGFDMPTAEGLRKAMSKKKPEEMAAYRERFIDGCITNGIDGELSRRIFDTVERFAGYGLNKAHAAAYGFVGYQSAYLKANFPVEFMSSWLTTEISNSAEIVRIVNEARRMGIAVLPPDVNKSGVDFLVEEHNGREAIRFSLNAVRNVGEAATKSIIETRGLFDTGAFRDITSLCKEIDWKHANRRTLESLAKAGALDCFGPRSLVMDQLEGAIAHGQARQKARGRGQMVLFEESSSGSRDMLLDVRSADTEIPKFTLLSWEREVLGVYLGDHPLVDLEGWIEARGYAFINELPFEEDREWTELICIAASVRKVTTKANRGMAIVRLEDTTGWVELIVFPDSYEKYGSLVETGSILHIVARMDRREGKYQLIAEHLDQEFPKEIRFLHLLFPSSANTDLMWAVDEVLSQHEGSDVIVVHFGSKSMVARKRKVQISGTLLIRLSNLLGNSNARVSTSRDVAY